MSLIEVNGLSRVFRTYKKRPGFWGGVAGLFNRQHEEIWAARDISFTIEEGEFVGFLGPNGAGKTTTLKMLAGLIYPTSGSARIAGFNPGKRDNAYRRIFSLVLGQKNQLWWDLPANESFALLRHIYDIPAASYRETLDELVSLLGVADKLGVMVRELSLGERMKMELIAALLHKPRVLFLDEPTIGLDIISQKAVRTFLREYNRKHRVTILLTSHYMADIEALCERVIIIHKGRKVYDGNLANLEGERNSRMRQVIFIPQDPAAVPAAWKSSYGDTTRESDTGKIIVQVKAEAISRAIQEIMSTTPIADITIEEEPLENIIGKVFSQ